MNKHNIRTSVSVIDDIQEPQLEPEKLEKENNMYDIIGMVADQYIVKTDKGLKRVKIKVSDNKRIGDQIKILSEAVHSRGIEFGGKLSEFFKVISINQVHTIFQ